MKLQALFPVILLISSLSFFTSCDKDADAKTLPAQAYTLGVDLQGGFDKDQVTVYIDDKKIFNNVVSTNNLLSLAASVTTSNTKGEHTIKVVVNDTQTGSEKFTFEKDTWIAVRNIKGKIAFSYSPTRYLYN